MVKSNKYHKEDSVKKDKYISKIKKYAPWLAGIFALLAVLVVLGDGPVLGEDRIYSMLGDRDGLGLSISKLLAFLGSARTLIPLLVLGLIYSVRSSRRDLFLGLLISIGGAFIIMGMLKYIFVRPRPEDYMLVDQGGYSFPSGHAMVNTSFYLFIAYYISTYINRNLKNIAFVLAGAGSVIMAMSRVYLGVHYLTDILAGICGGILVFFLNIYILKAMRKEV